MIKEVHSLGGSIDGLVPEAILERMNESKTDETQEDNYEGFRTFRRN